MHQATDSANRWAWLTEDYTPWANRYVYWLKTPLGVLIVLAAVALTMGLFVTPQGYVLLVTTLIIAGLGVVWPWIGLRGVTCELVFRTRRCREGEKAEVVVEIVNRWPIPVWGLSIENGFFVEDRDNDIDDAAVALARIPGWSRCEFVWPFQPQQRGIYPQSAPRIATAFPFGIWKATRAAKVEQTLTVWPRTYRLANFPLPQGKHRCTTSPSDRQTGHEGERIGVRPFRQGDSLRTIHWPLTARHGRFIVSERQGSAQAEARILIDTDPSAHHGIGPEGTFEWSLRMAASIGMELAQQHNRVVFDIGSQEVAMTGSQVSINKAMDWLAGVAPSTGKVEPRRMVDRSEWAIAIITDRSQGDWPTSRKIVLQCDNRGSTLPPQETKASGSVSRPWILIEDRGNVANQLSSQWTQRSQESWCGT
ncbi:DUF58 domain-containing protein [Blastopirellula marina]|uniref:DUF58 domain-containing protein n=1 Tax=Blastopirellula marina TaxID=124 RepID=A0A2S8G0S1_9BACT|nr:DUF58 domain-containing protein [Blastopirellula marina]PQO38037.1 hypothetical protein C5Y98_08095 [Blastopirellula marina]PTL44693.1 DUF58 domain-containing protein [Blastopirellula marina]